MKYLVEREDAVIRARRRQPGLQFVCRAWRRPGSCRGKSFGWLPGWTFWPTRLEVLAWGRIAWIAALTVIGAAVIVATTLDKPDASELEIRIADDPVRPILAKIVREASIVLESRHR
jgi:hypothetical protein